MKTKICFLAALLGMVFGPLPTAWLCGRATEDQASPAPGGSGAPRPKSPPPLVVDKNAPLLLEEPSAPDNAAGSTNAARQANNAACYVCHLNFKTEKLAQLHAQANIGCVDCHGDSFAHRNDENNTTPPQKMYPVQDIDRACGQCHARHDVPAAQVIARGMERNVAQADPKSVVCTLCHGQHRLTQRTVRWDKESGQLLPPSSLPGVKGCSGPGFNLNEPR